MKHKEIVTGVAGIVIGFVFGFFVSQISEQNDSVVPQQPSTVASSASSVPEDHPSPETLEKLRQLQTWAESNPEDSESRIVLGNFYYDMGRFDSAIQWYEGALALRPDDINVRTDLGTSYLYSGNAVRAVELYKESLKREPHHPQSLFNIGVAYSASGNLGEAITHWRQLLDSHPDHPHRQEIEERIKEAEAKLPQKRS